jgi:hypothetical protein
MVFCIQANALETLSYSGRLVQINGAPVMGPVNIKAELVYTNNLSTVLCSDDISGVALSKGVFHIKLDFACTGGKTLTQVLSQAPTGESVAIQITDVTNSKSYSFQALHALPYASVASQLTQMGAADGEFLKWNNTNKKWEPGSVSGASGGTVTNVSGTLPISVSNGTSTPAISISQANGTTSGYLSSADWTTFNNKEGTIAGGSAAQFYRGDKSWQTLDTSAVPENVNLYFTNARVLGVPLTGFASAVGAIVATDTTLAAFGKAQGQINAINTASANYLIKNSTDAISGLVNVGTTGLLQLNYVPVGMNDAVNKSYTDTKLALTGGTLTGVLTLDDDLKIKGGSNHVTVKGHSTSANYNLTLPQNAGTAGYVLSTDGSGNTSWVTPAIGSSNITDGSIVNADINSSAAIDQSKIANLTTDLAAKEPSISAGTTAQYWKGDKTWASLQTDVQALVLNGFTTGSNATLANTDTVAGAFGKVQGQIDAINSSIAGKEASLTAGSASQFYRGDKSWQTLNGVAVANTPAGNIAATTTQNAINELDSEKQDKLTATSVVDNRELRFYELPGNGTFYSSLKSPDDLTANINYTLPFVAPTVGQVLSSNASGVMSWISIPSAPVTTVFGRSGVVAAVNGDYTASQVTNTPAGSIAATDVQSALNELATEKEPVLTNPSDTTKYFRGDKTWATFATDAINSVLATFSVGTGTKPAVTNTDTVVGAFGKVQKTLNDINSDYVSKSANQTINGSLAINSLTGFLTVPTPLLPNDAVNKSYVDGFGQWIKNVTDVYYNGGSVAVGATSVNSSAILELSSTTKGFLPPRMSTTERDAIASPATGLIIFNTTLAKVEYYTGSGWIQSGQDQTCTTLYNSCAGIKAANSSSSSGTYLIDPDGAGAVQPLGVYCDMTTSGGGWTLVSAATDGNYFATTTEKDGFDINNPTPNSNKFSILDKTDAIAGGGNGTQRQYLYIDRRTNGNRWIVVQQTNSLNSSSVTGFSLINSSHAPNMSYLTGFGASSNGNSYYDGNLSNWIWAIAQRASYNANGYVAGIYSDGTSYTDNLSTGYAFFVKPGSNSSYQSCTQSPWIKVNTTAAYMDGNVGIGTTSPTAKLEVAGGIKPGSSGVAIGGACSSEGTFAYDSSAHQPVFCSNSGLWTSMSGTAGLGVGQTWQNVTASRTWSTTYTNNSGKPIQVQIGVVNSTPSDTTATTIYVDGVQVVYSGENSNRRSTFSFIVPNGSSYSANYGTTGGPVSIAFWSELR